MLCVTAPQLSGPWDQQALTARDASVRDEVCQPGYAHSPVTAPSLT